MIQSVVVSPAACGHIAAIPGIEIAAASRFTAADLPSSLRFKTTAKADLNRAQQDNRLWVATKDAEQVVGFAIADVVDGQAYLVEVGVMPAFGRLGIGTRLVQVTTDWARESKFDHVSLTTFRHLPWNAPFYRRLGFTQVAESEYGPELIELFELEKRAGLDTSKRIAMRLVF
ncbi:MAG: GNAT family N-acetyltransferase [Woeseiaceae bacterium]